LSEHGGVPQQVLHNLQETEVLRARQEQNYIGGVPVSGREACLTPVHVDSKLRMQIKKKLLVLGDYRFCRRLAQTINSCKIGYAYYIP